MYKERPFLPIGTTAPAFNSSALGTTSAIYVLQATGREWSLPSNRSVRIVGHAASAAYYAEFGDSGSSASTNSFLALGEQPYIVHVGAGITHLALVSTGAAPTVNVTIGSWGHTEEAYRHFIDTAPASTAALFTIQQAASVTGVQWSTEATLVWTIGDAAHIMGLYHYTTST